MGTSSTKNLENRWYSLISTKIKDKKGTIFFSWDCKFIKSVEYLPFWRSWITCSFWVLEEVWVERDRWKKCIRDRACAEILKPPNEQALSYFYSDCTLFCTLLSDHNLVPNNILENEHYFRKFIRSLTSGPKISKVAHKLGWRCDYQKNHSDSAGKQTSKPIKVANWILDIVHKWEINCQKYKWYSHNVLRAP